MSFEIGDKVRVKKWVDMVQEYGLHKDKHIVFPNKETFLPLMRHLCGKKGVIIGESENGFLLDMGEDWVFSAESLIKLK